MAPISGAYVDQEYVRSPQPNYSPMSSYFASPQPVPILPPRRNESSSKPIAQYLEEMVASASVTASSSTKRSGASLHQDPKGKAPAIAPELLLSPPKDFHEDKSNGSQSSSSSVKSYSSQTLPNDPDTTRIELPSPPMAKSLNYHERPPTRSSSRAQIPREYTPSRSSKPGPSVHRRILNDILHIYPHLSERSERDTASHDLGSYSTREGPSPSNSHPHQHEKRRRPSESHTQSQSHTHSRTHRSQGSTESISTILILTTERLHSETARANAAEKQAAEIMLLFKNTHEAKVKLEKDLTRVKEELGLYKIQLDVAQKEIFRAQEVVDRVERQRVEAEEAAARARERNRKLVEARAVDAAIEEGRRLGFEEGLKQGRMLSEPVVVQQEYYQPHRRSRRERASVSSSSKSSSQSSSSSHKTSSSIKRPTSVPVEESTQVLSNSTSSKPEDISVYDPNAPIRPILVHNHSPSVSHRPIVLPPDNFIPVLNADSTLTLPPPHELSQPVLATTPGASFEISTRGRESSRPTEAGPSAQRRYAPPRATSVGSPQSTRLSQLDLVSPPPYRQEARSERQREKMRQRASTVTAASQPSIERVERWREHSGDYTPAESPTPKRDAPDPNRIIPKNDIQRPTSTEVHSPAIYPNRPPRRPREVVMPVPLGDQLLQFNTAANAGPPRWMRTSKAHDNAPLSMLAPTQPPAAIRTVSNTTVPGIEVVTPSTHSAPSEKSTMNPVLLTPDHAHSPINLLPTEETSEPGLGLYDDPPEDQEVITGVLPDNNLPPGFVPLSPIPGMGNLRSYPGPPRGSALGPSTAQFYPSSPLARSED